MVISCNGAPFVFVDRAMCRGAVLWRIGRDDDESSAEARRDEWSRGWQRGDDQEEAADVPQPDQTGHRLLQPAGQSLQGEHLDRPSIRLSVDGIWPRGHKTSTSSL